MISSDRLSWTHVFAFLFGILLLVSLSEKSRTRIFADIAAIIMILVSGLRHGYIDTRAYRYGFEMLNVSKVLSLDFLLNGESKDRGFSFISAVIKVFTTDSQVFFLVLSVIITGCLFYTLLRYSPKMTFCIFLFITTGCYLDTMNGLRQAFASALLFAIGLPLLQKKKRTDYIILVLLCSTIHASALLFIPLYFVVTKEAWSKWTWIISGVALFVFAFFNMGIGSWIVQILDGTSYGEDYGEMLMMGNTSVNLIRPLVALVPIGLSFLDRGNEQKKSELYHICFNMSLINFLTWVFATKVLYFYRLAMYFQPYMILLLTYEVYYMRGRQNRKIILTLAYGLFLIWHVYSLYVTGDNFFVGYLKY